jgi:hypothetical protein
MENNNLAVQKGSLVKIIDLIPYLPISPPINGVGTTWYVEEVFYMGDEVFSVSVMMDGAIWLLPISALEIVDTP